MLTDAELPAANAITATNVCPAPDAGDKLTARLAALPDAGFCCTSAIVGGGGAVIVIELALDRLRVADVVDREELHRRRRRQREGPV